MKQGIRNNRIFFFLIMILTASPTFLFSQEMQGKMAENLCSAIRFTMEQPIRQLYGIKKNKNGLCFILTVWQMSKGSMV